MIEDYAVAFFDILGFKEKFERLGLSAIAEKYRSLVQVVNSINSRTESLFGEQQLKESIYWCQGGDVFPFIKIFGAYASDSLLIWSHAAWPEARGKKDAEKKQLALDPSSGWEYHTVPCDSFLLTCNEIICTALEHDLPLRGSLAMGKAILDDSQRIFLGAPLIESARLEKGQKFIGAGCCPSFMEQTIPKRFLLPFDSHLKSGYAPYFGGYILDWPRHWRKTRSTDLASTITRLREGSGSAAEYYDNTISTISLSDAYKSRFESDHDTSIRSVYKEFSSKDLKAHARAVRVIRE